MSDLDIQATWVSVLLDVGEVRARLEKDAAAQGQRWYGDDKVDELQNASRFTSRLAKVLEQLAEKPESWTRLLAVLANNVMFARNERALRLSLIKLAAFAVSWVEDIDRRKIPGYKDGNG